MQRWERELGLPVRRETGLRGENVYALVADVDAWLLEGERVRSRDDEPRGQGESAGSPLPARTLPAWRALFATGPRWLLPLSGVITSLAIVVLGGLYLPSFAKPKGEPARLLVDVDRIRALDADGRELWQYAFGSPLRTDAYTGKAGERPPYAIADIDGDGSREVLFRVSPLRGEGPIYCLNADGSVRFSWNQRSPVVFGNVEYQPPFSVGSSIAGRRNGRPVVWTVGLHSPYFPSLVTALNAKTGQPETAYWNCGSLNALGLGRIRGRDVVLAGGVDNELKRPVLLAIDVEAANGSTPVTNPYYRCDACPQAPPLAMVVFPLPDLPVQTANGGLSAVDQIYVDENGNFLLHLIYSTRPYEGEGTGRTGALYTLDRELRVVHAEFSSDYPVRHRYVEGLGLIDHRFKESEASQLFPVLVSFAGGPFERRTGPVAGE